MFGKKKEPPRIIVINEAEAAKDDRKFILWLLAVGAVVIIGLCLYFFLFGADSNPLDDRASSWSGKTYTNTALELQVDVPEFWIVQDGEQVLSESKEVTGVDQDLHLGKTLVSAIDPQYGTSLTLHAVYSDMASEEEMDAAVETRAQNLASLLNTTAFHIEQLDPIRVGGYDWSAYHIYFSDLGIEEYFLSRPFEDYIVMLYAFGVESEHPANYLSCVTSTNP